MADYPITPDGRYFVVRGRLWRCSNPALTLEERQRLVKRLMEARRQKGFAIRSGDIKARRQATLKIASAKIALGERGPVWWSDGGKDWNRDLAKNTPYADWFASI
jgi:ribosome recycling factor